MKHVLVKQLRSLWNNLEAIIIFLFFATFPLNIRKVFLTKYSYLNGEFNEYLTSSFSWPDLFVLFLILIYIIKYLSRQYYREASRNTKTYNNNGVLSNTIALLKSLLVSPAKPKVSLCSETFLLFLFLLWIALTIAWAPFKLIAIYRLFIILALVIFLKISLWLVKKDFIKAEFIFIGLIGGGIFQSLIGISQFLANRSIGLHFLGESILGPNLPGVAKIIVSGVKHIRAYGTFPHPNILAGFLILQIILIASLIWRKKKDSSRSKQNISHETILSRLPNSFFFVAFGTNFFCFLLTFSRSAYLSLAIVLFLLLLIKVRHIRPYYMPFLAGAILIILFLGITAVSQKPVNFLLSTQSLQERNQYSKVSREIIATHPIKGTGIGQFIFYEYSENPNWPGWQYQPVHNAYLLLTSELGIVGLILFLAIILTPLNNYCFMRNTPVLLTSIIYCFLIISFLIIAFFDHYFWDLKQGLIIFMIPFILLHIKTKNID